MARNICISPKHQHKQTMQTAPQCAPDVLKHGVIKQHSVLRYNSNGAAKRSAAQLAHIHPIDKYSTTAGIVQPRHKLSGARAGVCRQMWRGTCKLYLAWQLAVATKETEDNGVAVVWFQGD